MSVRGWVDARTIVQPEGLSQSPHRESNPRLSDLYGSDSTNWVTAYSGCLFKNKECSINIAHLGNIYAPFHARENMFPFPVFAGPSECQWIVLESGCIWLVYHKCIKAISADRLLPCRKVKPTKKAVTNIFLSLIPDTLGGKKHNSIILFAHVVREKFPYVVVPLEFPPPSCITGSSVKFS